MQTNYAIDYAIRQLKARYFRCLDTKDWEGWRGVFADDARMMVDTEVSAPGKVAESAPTVTGADNIVEHVQSLVGSCSTVHHGHTCEIEVLSEDEAKAIWAMQDIVEFDSYTLKGYGHYHETYACIAGCWFISELHLTRLRLESHPK